MNTFTSEQELASELSRVAKAGSVRIIGIDGKDGAGKTTVAERIARATNGTVVSLDEYVEKSRGGYVPYLRVPDAITAVGRAAPPVVLEGVCLLAAVETMGVELDKLIYVKRMSEHGFWLDEDECSLTQPVEDAIQRMEDDLRRFVQAERHIEEHTPDAHSESDEPVQLSELTKELIRYHAKYRPQEHADYVFHRTESLRVA